MNSKYTVVTIFTLLVTQQASCLLDGIQDHTIEARFQLMSQEIAQLKQTIAALQANTSVKSIGPVAFTATLSSGITLSANQHIIFDHVITNIGNSYNPFHGHFTAPIRGVYSFFVMVTNELIASATAALMKNGEHIAHVLAHGIGSHDLLTTSTIEINLQLEKGDQVWTQQFMDSTSRQVEAIKGYGWSLFSGNLIAEI